MTKMDRFSAHMDRGWGLIAKGETRQAFVAARQALEIDEESPEVHNLLGYIHAIDGDLDEALDQYRQAMELDEWYLDPVLNAAELLVHPDANPTEAIKLCHHATEIVTTSIEKIEVLLLEVDALLSLNKQAEALARLSNVKIDESIPPPHKMAMGRAFYEAGDIAGAKNLIELATMEDPDNPDAQYYTGLIARDEGRRVDAVVAFHNTRLRDLSVPTPPWVKQMTNIEPVVQKAIDALEPKLKAMLDQTQIVIAPIPTEEQVNSEIDPRQVVYAEGIDPAKRTFKKLLVFYLNLARAGVVPATLESDLTEMISRELSAGVDNV